MKTIPKILFLFFLFPLSIFAQKYSKTFDMMVGTHGALYAATGGKYKPSANAPGQYFRMLIIFAEFKGDSSVISNWQYGRLPDWANSFIDKEPSSSYRVPTVSDYFKKMSNGSFDVVGDIYDSVITIPTYMNYGSANKYILDILNSKNFNFKQYDNWGFNGADFVFSPGKGDGFLDMVYIVYRWADASSKTQWFGCKGAIANLNIGPDFITHDSVTIDGSGASVYGSGITLNCRGNIYDNFTIIGNLCHEFGHYLFGAGHTVMGGIMAGDPAPYGAETYAMSGYERSLLGYITFKSPPADGGQITLRDYVTTGDALKIPIPLNDPNSSTFYVVENHQRLSPYDQIMRGEPLNGGYNQNTRIGSGLYIWAISGGNNYPANIDIKSAAGAWDWIYDGDYYAGPGWYVGQPYEGYLPEIKKSKVDRDFGESGRYYDLIEWNNTEASKWLDINPLTGRYEITRDVFGRESDAYNPGYNEIFSPWSNPSTFFSGTNNFAFQLISQNGSALTLKVCTSKNTMLLLPPSKPQFLKTSAATGNHAVLTWSANIEPNLSSYKIYKAVTTGSEPSIYTHIATIPYNQANWIDPALNFSGGSVSIFYEVSAVNNSGLESVKSDYSVINYPGGQIHKLLH